MFKVNNRNTRKRCSIVNFEHVIADWVDDKFSTTTLDPLAF